MVMKGRHRIFAGSFPAGIALTILFLSVTQAVYCQENEVVEAEADSHPSTTARLEDSIYWQALQQPGGLETPIHSPSGDLEFVSFSLHQDLTPLQPLSAMPTPSTTQIQTSPQSVAAIFEGRSGNRLVRLTSRSRRPGAVADRILGSESQPRSATDVGSLLNRSARSRGIVAQKRNPIVTDPRVRGSRVGQLAASGSHWIPARIDLDTILSKVDSRIIDDVVVVKGPYSSQNGPGVSFIDFELLASPRSDGATALGGSSSLDYASNGQQFYGRQTVSVAESEWGLRVGYGHRTGNDYEAGDGSNIPSSYKSRALDVAFGVDPEPGQSLELMYLRLDQTDVELPGQAFDIDTLVTDGFEATWNDENIQWADLLTIEGWFNRTDLQGSAQRSGKRRTFPFLDAISFVGNTDIATMSTGARLASTWQHDDDHRTVAGTDIRVIRQELDEIASGRFGFNVFVNANSPIPRSVSVNPGLFLEHIRKVGDSTEITGGIRTDVVTTEVLATGSQVQSVGTAGVPLSAMLGTDDFDQSFGLWSTYLTAEHKVDEFWKVNAAVGYGMRPPSLTELYVAESFMFLLQSGLNTVTGDPRLNAERQWQIDLGIDYSDDTFTASGNFFHAWVHDRITFEALAVRPGPFGQIEQTKLKYVNTERATLFGFEGEAQWKFLENASLFGQLSYVEGTDHTRNGNFATLEASASPLTPSTRVAGMPRGAFSGVAGGSEEPLPGIPPLESRVGLRLYGTVVEAPVSLEIAARIVNDQDRVASSLLESGTPGFTVFDARGFMKMNDSVSVVAGVENFTDKNYREHFDFRSTAGQSIRQPGINFYLGTEVVY